MGTSQQQLLFYSYFCWFSKPPFSQLPTPSKMARYVLAVVVAVAIGAFCVEAAKTGRDDPYLVAKGSEEGVATTKSGLMYKRITSVTDPKAKTPKVSTPCSCHYKGTLTDGTQFDSSYDRGSPTTFAPNQVIKGWTEAMQLMREGEKFELYIPYELAYGAAGRPPTIPAKATLVFTLELLEVKGPHVNLDL